jgi:hypothetical protein
LGRCARCGNHEQAAYSSVCCYTTAHRKRCFFCPSKIKLKSNQDHNLFSSVIASLCMSSPSCVSKLNSTSLIAILLAPSFTTCDYIHKRHPCEQPRKTKTRNACGRSEVQFCMLQFAWIGPLMIFSRATVYRRISRRTARKRHDCSLIPGT